MNDDRLNETHWYELTATDCLDALESQPSGLSPKEVLNRQLRYGANELQFHRTPTWLRLLRQFYDPMVIILLITSTITAVITALGGHMLADTVVILSVVILNALLGFVQEGKAEGALDALRDMMVQECLVLREGDQQRIPASTLVPGDIVILEGGDKLPADVRFIELNNTRVDESALTGESVPAEKQLEALPPGELVPADQSNMGFSGTFLTGGTARGLVVATGTNTVFGRIADLVQSADSGLTPLQRKMKTFVHSLIAAILVVGGINFLLGIYLGYATSYSFLGAVSLVVAAIPEMLPALVTSILALSGTVMAGRKALIRKLPAAETLGATSVICSDKTGTLTENRMTVTRLYSGGEEFCVSGVGYNIEGEFCIDEQTAINPRDYRSLMRLLYTGFYCNNAHLHAEGGHTGDPTEIALRVSGAKADLVVDGVHRLAEIPFDSSSKFMAVLVCQEDRRFILVKGAPEFIINMCETELDHN